MRTVLIRFFLFLILVVPLFATPSRVSAQASINNQNLQSILSGWDRSNLGGSINFETMQDLGFQMPFWTVGTLVFGHRSNDVQLNMKYKQNGAIALIGSGMLAMYANPPANTGVWIADVGQSLGFLPKQAYAQSTGFDGLRPLLTLWRGFRNVAYLLMTLILIIIGFMVMFRRKIDPKTVVTVQDALPRIVITLILITFSYAIAALMIDLLYLLMLLALSVIASAGINGLNFEQLRTTYMTGDLFQLFGATFAPLQAFSSGEASRNWAIGLGILGTAVGTPVVGLIGAIIGLFVGAAVDANSWLGFANPILYGIFAIALLFGFLRIFFMLLGAYIQIILAVIIGPIQIMLDALPGGEGFMSWIKNLFSNIIVFPITITLLALGGAISTNIDTSSQNLWVAPFLPAFSPLIAKGLIGLGITLSTPGIVNGIRESFKAKSPIPAAAGAGAAFGILGTAGRMGIEHYMRGRQMRHLYQPGSKQLEHDKKPEPANPR